MPSLCRKCFNTFNEEGRCPRCSSPLVVSHSELFDLNIAHMDCDAFYASVEKRDNPDLADMPVIISILNALTGVSAALAGIIYDNMVMLMGGILVGSSGAILTVLMCQAMNRSLLNVLAGGFGGELGSAAQVGNQMVKEVNIMDASIMLRYSENVVIVPGYGMAVAQAQKICKELERRYDIKIQFQDNLQKNTTISGIIDLSPNNLDSVLSSISLLSKRKFKLQGDSYILL